MKGKTLSNLLLLGWCVILMIACSGEKPHYVIGVSQCSEDIWRSWQNAEMVMESNFHDGVELRFATALDDSERQIQQIDSLVDSGIQLLIVAPNQRSSVKSAIDRAYDKGIPVIVFERKTDSQKYTAFVSADNYEMGRLMGEYVVSRLDGKGNVLEVAGLKGSSPAEERHKGFFDALAQYPEVKVVKMLQGDWTEPTAYQAVKDYKGDLNNIDVVFGHNDRSAMGARKVFQERQAKMPLFCGIDGLPGENGGIRQVRDSLLDASYIYPTRGDLLLQLALDILEGKPYAKETLLTSALVTHDNANVLLLESDEVARQAQNLDKLQMQASSYLKQLDTQRTITLMALILIALLLLTMVLFFLYHRSVHRIDAVTKGFQILCERLLICRDHLLSVLSDHRNGFFTLGFDPFTFFNGKLVFYQRCFEFLIHCYSRHISDRTACRSCYNCQRTTADAFYYGRKSSRVHSRA